MARFSVFYDGSFGSGDLSSNGASRGLERYGLSYSASMDRIESLMTPFRFSPGAGIFSTAGQPISMTVILPPPGQPISMTVILPPPGRIPDKVQRNLSITTRIHFKLVI